MSRWHVGIDPGATGGLALLDSRGACHFAARMPTHARGKADRVDGETLARYFREALAVAARLGMTSWALCLEEVGSRPGQGVASMFSFGHAAGMVEGVGMASTPPPGDLRMLKPGLWQAIVLPPRWAAGLSCPRARRAHRQALTRAWAVQAFGVRPTTPKGCHGPHMGIVDALALAYASYRLDSNPGAFACPKYPEQDPTL